MKDKTHDQNKTKATSTQSTYDLAPFTETPSSPHSTRVQHNSTTLYTKQQTLPYDHFTPSDPSSNTLEGTKTLDELYSSIELETSTLEDSIPENVQLDAIHETPSEQVILEAQEVRAPSIRIPPPIPEAWEWDAIQEAERIQSSHSGVVGYCIALVALLGSLLLLWYSVR